METLVTKEKTELYQRAEKFFAQPGWDGAEPFAIATAFVEEEKCKHARHIAVVGKVSDLCYVKCGEEERDGNVPSGLHIGHGDYLEFQMCLDCGQVLNAKFPIAQEVVDAVFE